MSTIPERVVRLAEQRHGFVTTQQLTQLGLRKSQIQSLVLSNHITHHEYGVWRTRSTPCAFDERAALLSHLAPKGALSHSTAARLWGIRTATRDQLEILVPVSFRGRPRGALIHRTRDFDELDVSFLADGTRLTSPARTLFDLGGSVDAFRHRSALEHSLQLGIVSIDDLLELANRVRSRGRRGSAAFGELVATFAHLPLPVRSSVDEITVADALVEAGITGFVRQFSIRLPTGSKIFADIAHPGLKLAIEVDHSYWHASTPEAVRADKARDIQLLKIGWRVIRITEYEVEHQLASTVASIAAIAGREMV